MSSPTPEPLDLEAIKARRGRQVPNDMMSVLGYYFENRDDIDALIAEVERLTAALEQIRDDPDVRSGFIAASNIADAALNQEKEPKL